MKAQESGRAGWLLLASAGVGVQRAETSRAEATTRRQPMRCRRKKKFIPNWGPIFFQIWYRAHFTAIVRFAVGRRPPYFFFCRPPMKLILDTVRGGEGKDAGGELRRRAVCRRGASPGCARYLRRTAAGRTAPTRPRGGRRLRPSSSGPRWPAVTNRPRRRRDVQRAGSYQTPRAVSWHWASTRRTATCTIAARSVTSRGATVSAVPLSVRSTCCSRARVPAPRVAHATSP